MKRLAILVTGARSWVDEKRIQDAVRRLCAADDWEQVVLIHGDAKGADTIAAKEARLQMCDVIAMPANWNAHGNGAGPRRNTEMVRVLQCLRACGYVCRVLACPMPDSKGTLDCMRTAQMAGFKVEEP